MQVTANALKLEKNRKKHKLVTTSPFKRTPHIQNAIVLDLIQIEPKQPNSAKRKIACVQLVQSKKKIKTYIPKCGGKEFIKLHDVVTIQSIGGSLGRARGDLYGLNTKIIKVNGQCLNQLYLKKI